MRYWHPTLFIVGAAGAIFTVMFVATWVAYVWGDGDGERAAFLTVVGVFAGPLLAGAVLAWQGRRSRHPNVSISSLPSLWRVFLSVPSPRCRATPRT